MRVALRSISCVAFACMAFAGAHPAAAAPDCRSAALERLQTSAPEGFAIYQKIKDKKFFVHWISCSEAQRGLSTAVHESVHYIAGDADAFPLINGGQLKRPHEVSAFFPPSQIAGKFKGNDFADTYLRPGRASSSTDFLYLLDELNAYTHDLNTAVKLNRGPAEQGDEVDHRDGLASLMAFVALYLERAQESEPATWTGLQQPRVAKAVSELWGSAEKVMASSCGIPNFGSEDKSRIRQFCQSGPQAALQKILGRAPVCPTACLKAVPVAARGNVDTMPTGSVRSTPAATPLRPFWSRTITRRPAPSDDVEVDDESED